MKKMQILIGQGSWCLSKLVELYLNDLYIYNSWKCRYLVELQFFYQPSETVTKAFLLEAAAEHFQNFNHHNQNLDGLT